MTWASVVYLSWAFLCGEGGQSRLFLQLFESRDDSEQVRSCDVLGIHLFELSGVRDGCAQMRCRPVCLSATLSVGGRGAGRVPSGAHHLVLGICWLLDICCLEWLLPGTACVSDICCLGQLRSFAPVSRAAVVLCSCCLGQLLFWTAVVFGFCCVWALCT